RRSSSIKAIIIAAFWTLCSSAVLMAQPMVPYSHSIGGQFVDPRYNGRLLSTKGSAPRGNFIADIVYDKPTDRIWVATNKGPAFSSDDGATWTNFYGDGSFNGDTANCSAIAVRG